MIIFSPVIDQKIRHKPKLTKTLLPFSACGNTNSLWDGCCLAFSHKAALQNGVPLMTSHEWWRHYSFSRIFLEYNGEGNFKTKICFFSCELNFQNTFWNFIPAKIHCYRFLRSDSSVNFTVMNQNVPSVFRILWLAFCYIKKLYLWSRSLDSLPSF